MLSQRVSLVGGVVVADHLRQDPLLVSVHRLHPRRHLVPLLGHVVAAGRRGPAQRRGAENQDRVLNGSGSGGELDWDPGSEPGRVPLSWLADPQRERHGRLLQQRHQNAASHRLPGRIAVAVHPRHLSSWNNRDGSGPEPAPAPGLTETYRSAAPPAET